MLKNLFSNFWARNSLFFFFILLLARLNNDHGSFSDFNLERFKIYFSYLVDYSWVLMHNKLLFERYFLKKRISTYFLLLPLSYLIYFIFFYFLGTSTNVTPGSVITSILNLSAIKLLGLGLYFIVRYILERERFYKATITAKELEMQLLKGQLNPHFLFNALNNIYSHLISGTGNGQELILKLSELMRYILDSNRRDFVSLQEEIRFIDHYIAFEQERLGNRCEIVLTKQIDNPSMKIAPLILFTFIENAFKHGTLSIRKSVIEISIVSTPKGLSLSVTNPVFDDVANSTKVGLSNTKRRLELIYPGQHSVEIDHSDELYKVEFALMPAGI